MLPHGKGVELRKLVNSDHAGEKLTRRLWTGMLIFLNMAMIDWISKKQPTVKTSVFSAKFVSMKCRIKKARALL